MHLNSQSMDAFVQDVDRDENIILYIKYMTESIFFGWDSFKDRKILWYFDFKLRSVVLIPVHIKQQLNML